MRIVRKILFIHLFIIFPTFIAAQVSPSDLDSLRNLAAKHGLTDLAASKAARSGKMYFLDSDIKYSSLEEASLDVERLLEEVSSEREQNKLSNESLSFRLSQRNKRNLKKDQIARDAWSNMIKKDDTTVDDLVDLYAKFGNKPTYYVNGTQVDQPLLDRLSPNDVIATEVKVSGTLSGNPNGEIWYQITPKTADKIKLSSYRMHEDRTMLANKEAANVPSTFQQQYSNNRLGTSNREQMAVVSATNVSLSARNQNMGLIAEQAESVTVESPIIELGSSIAASRNWRVRETDASTSPVIVAAPKIDSMDKKATDVNEQKIPINKERVTSDNVVRTPSFPTEKMTVARESSSGTYVQNTKSRAANTLSASNSEESNWVTRHYNEKEQERKVQIQTDQELLKAQQLKNEELQRQIEYAEMLKQQQTQQQIQQSNNQEVPTYSSRQPDLDKDKEESPKKSVRKIKERQREKYEE